MKCKIAKIVCASLLLSFLFSANVFAEATAKTLTVTGNGNIKATPDIAYLNVGVRTSDKDAETASKQNLEITNAIVDELKLSGIEEKDIKTQYYNVSPSYDYSTFERAENSIKGYEVSNSLNITIRNIDEAGKIIDVCISAGANMVNGLSYAVETPSSYYDRLFERAINDANKKSSSIAKALGITLSTPVSVSDGGYVNAGQTYVNLNTSMKDAGVAGSMASTYTIPGDIDLYANVVVSYTYE